MERIKTMRPDCGGGDNINASAGISFKHAVHVRFSRLLATSQNRNREAMRKLTTIEILAIIAITEILLTGKLHGGVILFVCYGVYKIAKTTFDYIVNDDI